ncbi:TRAP transporter substrate-binding protein [Kordiimonas aestuarii]|uniref:TRAP transporter substrate-binding protein n=1 Tax=Kordiimonas aestuarii TaxID=1005925 RepID=UPI0021D2BC59|nr:TRAP transporter substrate-binding protein [Kordiimonas aestuarii]
MLNRRHLLTSLAATAALPAFSGLARAAAVEQTLRVAEVHVHDFPTVKAMQWMNGELMQAFRGRLGMTVYHSGQLGREKDTLQLARVGALACTRVHSSALNNAVPATRILSLPYVFDSTEHMRRVFDGPVGEEILAACRAIGLIGLAIYDSGSRNFYNTRHPIETPEDLHGLKLRVPQSDIFIETVAALGANPTPLSYGEVFSSLQTHLIDGAENNWPSFQTSQQYKIANYWSETEHSFAPDILLMSKKVADALGAEESGFMIEAAKRSVPVMRQHWDAAVGKSREIVLAAGAKVNAVDKGAFRKANEPLLDRYLRDPEIRRLYDAIRAQA